MKVLFVGLGGIGQRHLRNLLRLKSTGVDIFAYRVRKNPTVLDDKLQVQAGAVLEERYPITVCPSLEEAWEQQIDAVFICNPSSMHYDILRQAVEHSCDIFVEKPVSDSLVGLEEIVRQCREKRLVTFVGYQNRFHPCIEEAKRILDSHGIGSVLAVNAEIGEDVRSWHKYEDYRTMYACRKDLGGGVVLSQIHELDYIPFLLSAKPRLVFAAGGKLSDLEIDVEDVASILLVCEAAGKEIPVHIHEDYLQNPPSRTCKILGTEGRIEFDLLHAELRQYGPDGQTVLHQKYAFERNEMFLKEMGLFLDAVETRTEACINMEAGMKSLELAAAVKRSMAEQAAIRL